MKGRLTSVKMGLAEYSPLLTYASYSAVRQSRFKMRAKVSCTTESVEYPATFLTGMPLCAAASRSMLLTPVAASQMSLRFGAASISSAVTFTLLMMRTSASFTLSRASCGEE